MLTTQQAAEKLGITRRRVLALIQSGDLEAERFGSSWMVDDTSVAKRLSHERLRGRPVMGVRDQDRLERYTLMNGEREVADIAFDKGSRRVGAIKPCADATWAPPGACGIDGSLNRFNLNGWVARRYIPGTRSGLAELLRSAGCDNPAGLMFGSLGLNLSDQYWFRPAGTNLNWHDVNYFENHYRDRAHNIMGPQKQSLFGPSTSTNGQLVKWWERRNGRDWLVKGSSHACHEPFAELLATRLYERLLDTDDYVPYQLEYIGDEPYSSCPGFITQRTELVSLEDIEIRYGTGYPKSRYANYLSILEKLGIADARQKIAKMIVCDYLTANMDRHDGNLGAIRDACTLEWLGVAPIFDNGRAFFFAARREDELTKGMFRYTSNPFEEFPSRQLALVEDFRWFDPARLEGFESEIEETLARNPELPAWFAHGAAVQFARRLERVVEAMQERW